jgi:hypothetical protein
MPIGTEDSTPLNITGDPAPQAPMSQRQVAGQQKAQANRTQQGPQAKDIGQRNTAGTQPKPDKPDKPDPAAPGTPPAAGDAAAAPTQGIGPAWNALVAGIGTIQKDPAWMQHPLLRLMTDPTSETPQSIYAAGQWFGRVLWAGLDPNATHASAINIEHDNSFQGQVAQNLFNIHDNPVNNFAWNAIPWALAIAASWEPWIWVPEMMAQGPDQLKNLPQALMSLTGGDLAHPQFEDPMWYARMGQYVLGAAIVAKGGGKAIGPLMKFTGRLKVLEPVAAHFDRILGGPGDKTPIKGPDNITYDPNVDPEGAKAAAWWNDNIKPLDASSTDIGKTSLKPEEGLVKKPIGEGGDMGYAATTTLDPAAKGEFAQALGLGPDSTPADVVDRLELMAEKRGLSPRLSQQILDNWDRWGPAIEHWGKFKYYHGSEAQFHNALESMRAIPDVGLRNRAFSAMRAANGFHADLQSGVHSYGNNLLESLTKGLISHSRSTDHYGGEMISHVEKVLGKDSVLRSAVQLAIEDPNLETDATRARLKDQAYGRSVPSEVVPRGTVSPSGKPIYMMNPDELEAARVADKASEQGSAVEVFGVEKAKEYERLQRIANGTSSAATQASKDIEKMESALTSEQQSRLFGIGDSTPTHEDYTTFKRHLSVVQNAGDAKDLGESLRWAITRVGDGDPMHMDQQQQMAWAQLRYGMEIADREGWDTAEVSRAAIQGAASRFSDPADAKFMLQRLSPKALQLPSPAPITAKLHALENLNAMEGGDGAAVTRYDSLSEHGKWAHDFARQLMHAVSEAKMKAGVPGYSPQPNFVYRVVVDTANLEKELKGTDNSVRVSARSARGKTPFGHYHHEHRSVVLVGSATEEGGIHAETAGKTTNESNLARDEWRNQMKADLIERAKSNPKLAAIVKDSRKFDALLHAELPAFSTDIMDSLKAMMKDVKDLQTHQVMEEAKRTLVEDPTDGRWHPLAVARSEAGQESSPALDAHFKELHSADTTNNFYSGQLGYKSIQGLSSGGYVFHPRFAEPLNSLYDLHKADPDGWYRALRKISASGKHVIMLNPMWHAVNMAGRFAWLAGKDPVGMARTIMKAKGVGGKMTSEQLAYWWDAQERELFNHGGVTPQLHEDVTQTIGRNHMFATGDVEVGQPLDVKTPVTGFKTAIADSVGAIKGADAWYQNHINDRFWNQYRQFHTLAYITLKEDALKRGMAAGDARIFAASQANRWAGMTTPDRWMNNPFMYKASQLALFAPNWWRTFPGLILGTYDRMGMKSNPALTHAWALNTAKAIGAMALVKAGSDNALNFAMSGHWQFQNADGYKNQITLDRWFPPDPTTGAHTVMEDPIERQPHDLEVALGIDEAMKYGYWKPQFAEQGTAEVFLARMSPLLQAMDTASNFDLYNTIKQRALKWVDPQHPSVMGSGQAALAGAANLTPMGYAAQAALQGATAADGTLASGPWAGTKIPGWAMRAFDPNDPLVPVLSLLGIRGGYPSPVSSEGRGLSSDEVTTLHNYSNAWNTRLTQLQQSVVGGGKTFADFAYDYKQGAAAYANQVQGLTDGTSNYMQGADGLLSQYEGVYNDPKAFDPNGDVNWKYIQTAQDQLQAKVFAEPNGQATWRQMVALKDKREMQYPVLRAYKDSLANYKNFQDSWAKDNATDGETLRSLIAGGASSADFYAYEGQHPQLAAFYASRRSWELQSKQGFAYGMFTNNSYVMRVIEASAGGSTTQQVSSTEDKVLPQIESSEAAGQFVTPTGQ